jgi:predicted DNA-binding transcriptional regulator AlpA
MARKHEVCRPFAPDYCSRETLAYRLDVTAGTVSEWARSGRLPKPLEVGASQRWSWADVQAWIRARNGLPGDADGTKDELDRSRIELQVSGVDPFLAGLKNGTAAHG